MKPTRQEMIRELTQYELQYLIDNPEWLEDAAEFFANGGFDNVNIDDLEDAYIKKIEPIATDESRSYGPHA